MKPQEADQTPKCRNSRFGPFWFGRTLCVVAFVAVIGGTAAVIGWRDVKGAEAVRLLIEAFWALFAFALLYNGRAWAYDKLADAIRAIRGKL